MWVEELHKIKELFFILINVKHTKFPFTSMRHTILFEVSHVHFKFLRFSGNKVIEKFCYTIQNIHYLVWISCNTLILNLK